MNLANKISREYEEHFIKFYFIYSKTNSPDYLKEELKRRKLEKDIVSHGIESSYIPLELFLSEELS